MIASRIVPQHHTSSESSIYSLYFSQPLSRVELLPHCIYLGAPSWVRYSPSAISLYGTFRRLGVPATGSIQPSKEAPSFGVEPVSSHWTIRSFGRTRNAVLLGIRLPRRSSCRSVSSPSHRVVVTSLLPFECGNICGCALWCHNDYFLRPSIQFRILPYASWSSSCRPSSSSTMSSYLASVGTLEWPAPGGWTTRFCPKVPEIRLPKLNHSSNFCSPTSPSK
jgi:hypothetical protein